MGFQTEITELVCIYVKLGDFFFSNFINKDKLQGESKVCLFLENGGDLLSRHGECKHFLLGIKFIGRD